jgi:hypothetical protein
MSSLINNSDKIKETRAQSTVEAAFMIPVILILILLLLQPSIILYDFIVMKSAASEGCRLIATNSGLDSKNVDDFIRRRLSAIPQADIFHIHNGSCSYEIEFNGGESEKSSSVVIKNSIKPLPLIGGALELMGATEDGDLTICASEEMSVQPSWVS